MFSKEMLMEGIRNLPPIKGTTRWKVYRDGIRREILNLDLDNFLSFPTIRSTMYVGGEFSYHDPELAFFYASNYKNISIKDSPIGTPIVNQSTGMSYDLTHQLNYLVEYNNITGKRPERFRSIVEFGGGFGLLRYIFDQLDFSGTYTIYDFPEFCLLQRYYLEQSGIFNTEFIPIEENSIFSERITDLLIGIYSLSESSIEQRTNFLNSIITDSYLIAFQKKFDDLDNLNFFKNYFKTTEIRLSYLSSHRLGNLFTGYVIR